jgi:hypothetical protein
MKIAVLAKSEFVRVGGGPPGSRNCIVSLESDQLCLVDRTIILKSGFVKVLRASRRSESESSAGEQKNKDFACFNHFERKLLPPLRASVGMIARAREPRMQARPAPNLSADGRVMLRSATKGPRGFRAPLHSIPETASIACPRGLLLSNRAKKYPRGPTSPCCDKEPGQGRGTTPFAER